MHCCLLILLTIVCTSVCSPPDLPAGALFYLVWEPFRLEGQQNGLEAPGVFWDLPDHAYPFPHLLDCTEVKGFHQIYSNIQAFNAVNYYFKQ